MLVKNCCCCSLKKGCLVIGYLSLILSALFLLNSMAAFVEDSWRLPSHIPELVQNIIYLIEGAAEVILASILLAGIYQGKKKFVFVFFIGTIITELIGFSLGFDCVTACFGEKKYVKGTILLVAVLGSLALVIYILIVVYSYYKASDE